MLTIGKRFKEVRTILGLNKTEMAANVVNRTFYGRIENNQNKISTKNFFALLEAHQIPILCFLRGLGDVEPKNKKYRQQISNAYEQKDLKRLQTIKKKKSFNDQKMQLIVTWLLADLEDKKQNFPVAQRGKLKYHLFKNWHWDNNSLWIFSLSMNLYNFHELQGIVDSIFNHYQTNTDDEERLEILSNIAVSYLVLCDQKEDHDEVQRSINFLNHLPSSALIALQKLVGQAFAAKYQRDKETYKVLQSVIAENGYNYIFKI